MNRIFMVAVLGAAAAQARAAVLEGVVRDASGGVVPAARVEVLGPSGPARTETADARGRFKVPDLTDGRYTVVASQTGFSPATASVELNGSAAPAPVEIALQVLTARETVTVTESATGLALETEGKTGSRIGLTNREIPATIDILAQQQIQERGLRNTTEVLNSIPAVTSALLPSAPGIMSIRGFSGGAISTLYDGTRVTTSTIIARSVDTWSFDRVEVLKGPASVLYGEGALAGAVNYVPKRPSFTIRRTDFLVGYDSLETPRLAAGTTGPLGERAAYRFDAAWMHSSGYRDAGASSTLALNGVVDVKLGGRGMLTVAADHYRDDYDTSDFGTPLVPRAFARQPTNLVSDTRDYVIDGATRDRNYDVEDAVVKSDTTWLRSKLSWAFSSKLRLVADAYSYDALRKYRNAEVYSFVPLTNLLSRSTVSIDHDHQFRGGRVALAYDGTDLGFRNRATIGAEVNHNDFFSPRRFGSMAAVDPFAPARGVFPDDNAQNFPGAGNRTDFTTDIGLTSLFVENAANVTDRLLLVGGVRYDDFNVERAVEDLNAATSSSRFERNYSPVSWRAGAVFDIRKKTQLFGQYTWAVAPVATLVLISQANADFELTTGWSWEGGVKTSLFSDKTDLTVAAFKIQQDDILTRDPNNANITIQGGTQSSKGVELSISAAIAPQLRVDASVAFMEARFDELLEAGGVDRAGNVPPNVPEQTAGVRATYSVPRTPLSLYAGVRHRGRFFTNNANSTEVRSATLVDAAANWKVSSFGTVSLRGRNLTDTLHADWSGASASQLLIGAPRSFELSFTSGF